MELRIRNLHDAAIRSLKTGYRGYDRLKDRNNRIMSWLFNRTKDGLIKGFYLKDEKRFRAYHLSTKKEKTVQFSYGFFRDGELIPLGDLQMESLKDLFNEGYSSGTYGIIG